MKVVMHPAQEPLMFTVGFLEVYQFENVLKTQATILFFTF